MDGSDQPLPEIDGIDWTKREVVNVHLPHPEIDPQWCPTWFALRLDRATDAHILNHSIAWALEEAAPAHVRAGLGRRVSGWFMTSGHSIQSVARHWAQSMVRRAPQGKGRVLLRLHDPAVLWAVWQTLPPAQRDQWLGPVSQWHLLTPSGDLRLLESSAHPNGDDVSPYSPDLNAQQWQDIQNITPLHLTMQRLASTDLPSAAEYQQMLLTGLHALRRANLYGFNDPHSLSLFAELAITRHPQFDEHPELQRLLRQREPDEPLGGLLSDLTDLDWQRLIDEVSERPRPN